MPSELASRRIAVFSFPSLGVFALVGSAWAQRSPSLERSVEPARVADTDALVPIVIEGLVLDPEGIPAEGAVVISSAGGKAVTDPDGRFTLEAQVQLGSTSVQVTAVGGNAGRLVASTPVVLSALGSRVAWVGPLRLALGSSCDPGWLPTFGGFPGTSATVRALAVYDDGSGPALHAGGDFQFAGSTTVNRIAKWDGSSWTALGSGVSDTVFALAVHDDGSGPALFAAGGFTTAGGAPAARIAKWDGSTWTALGTGLSSFVGTLCVHDDGSGAALFAGGGFTTAGGAPAARIAKWDGSTWSALGSGLNGAVRALAVHDDGSGPALYAGGSFTTAGGAAANRIARWKSSSWSALGSGLSNEVYSLAVYDDGGGPALCAGGSFTTAGGAAANYIAKWKTSSWSALGSGMNNHVYVLRLFDHDGELSLCAGGKFTSAGGLAASQIAAWDGAGWEALESGLEGLGLDGGFGVQALTVHDDGSGPALFVGGAFKTAGGAGAAHVAKRHGPSWSALGKGLNGTVRALTVHDDGSGPALYAGGEFTTAGGVAANYIAKWDGVSWSALGSGMNYFVYALTSFDDGSGPALYAGGSFTTAGGVTVNYIAKWDGSSWSALDGGVALGIVQCLTVFDDGGGPALYAGGGFTSAGGVPASRIARWDGSTWASLGSGLTIDDNITDLAVYDDGSGPALHAGGFFTNAGGVTAKRVAKWNGSTWESLGSGIGDSIEGSYVWKLAVFDDGSGSALYVGGYFGDAGGVGATSIARWDGSSWSAFGAGAPPHLLAMTVHDDGSGPALYAAYDASTNGGIRRWDGSSWSTLEGGSYAWSLASFDDGNGPSLFAGGSFPDSGDFFLGKWGCDRLPPALTCLPVVVAESSGGPPGEVVSFSVTAIDNHDPSPDVVCVPPSGSFFPAGMTIVTCTATDDAGNQSTCQFPVSILPKRQPRKF